MTRRTRPDHRGAGIGSGIAGPWATRSGLRRCSRAGIVGLPNVGKSTLFNALTRTRKAEAANYPFCTIEPNVGVVDGARRAARAARPDREDRRGSSRRRSSSWTSRAWSGASKGEGLGNKFLQHIREVDAIVEVVRCFEDRDVITSPGARPGGATSRRSRPSSCSRTSRRVERRPRQGREDGARRRDGTAEDAARRRRAARAAPGLGQAGADAPAHAGREAIAQPALPPDRRSPSSSRPTSPRRSSPAADASRTSVAVRRLRGDAPRHRGGRRLGRRSNRELAELPEAEAAEYLAHLGVAESGVGALIRAAYHLLGLRTFFTAGEKEARAWTIHAGDTAPQAAAGVIHSDFERGFIKAETVALRRPASRRARSRPPARRASCARKARTTSSPTAT